MNSFKKTQKSEEITYFKKKKPVSIEDVSIGSVVYLKIKTNAKTSITEVEYYGKIVNCTKSYFSVLVYFQSLWRLDNWKKSEIDIKEKSPDKYTIKRAKKSIVEIWTVETKQKIENIEYYNNI